jgi:hypothetical protein
LVLQKASGLDEEEMKKAVRPFFISPQTTRKITSGGPI